MARLACAFLVFMLAYQCADVVNGAVKEEDLPDFVGNKGDFLETLKKLCKDNHSTGVVAHLDLPHCQVFCATSAFWGIFGGSPTVTLKNREPCSNDGGICVKGQCAYES
uniref:Putative ixodes 8-cys protein n=1 Tax=Ixodes ricinus TaxID=34613 RepID=A0A0K8RJM1_IXORI